MIAVKNEKPVSIGVAAKATNTTAKMLRYWEEKGYISPEKVVSGSRSYRWYYPDDIQRIDKIKQYIDPGLHAAGCGPNG